jgi:hypothetical protein
MIQFQYGREMFRINPPYFEDKPIVATIGNMNLAN